VAAHSNCTTNLAAGVKALFDGNQTAAHAQALWRFLANDAVTPEGLAAPLLAHRHAMVKEACDAYALSIHDWSRINYRTHQGKRDRKQLTHETDVGYELQSSLLVSDRDGAPLVAPAQNWVTAEGVWQSRCSGLVREEQAHLDELTERMAWLERQGFGRPLVHVIDREADSVGHWRQWSEAGQLWLVRIKGGSTLRFQDRRCKAEDVAQSLEFQRVREVNCDGKAAEQWIGCAEVVITRPARPKQKDADGRRQAPVPGPPLAARLVVSRILDEQGRLVAEWYLLTNVPSEVEGDRIALWYYYRWQIESYFKLLKEAGHQLESWEQETGLALFKRLLIASQSCVLVWRLLREQGEWPQRTKEFLVRLSGRQTKRSRPITASAVLDGLFKLFTLLETLHEYSVEELRAFADFAFPRRFPSAQEDSPELV
jgi:hypothetical protein